METAVLNPLAPTPRGQWSGHGVRVRRRRGPHRRHAEDQSLCTPRFCVQRHGGLLTVEHDLVPDELCDELAVMLA
ncbi:SAM-dependent methyltransferase, partial [Mycobacterium sp. ITM-2017-0098]